MSGKENAPAVEDRGAYREGAEASNTDSTRWASLGGSDVNLEALGSGGTARFEVYLAGWAAGYEARQARIERLEWLVNLYYFLAANPGRTAADYYRQLENDLWRQAVIS